MVDTPDIASLSALIGDPARSRLLIALVDGRALTATELANTIGVTKQTTSAHLAKLLGAHLIAVENQGRHRYFRLAGREVAGLLEHLMSVASRTGLPTVRTGPASSAMRTARVCYDHLAGDFAVQIFESLERHQSFEPAEGGMRLSRRGIALFEDIGIDVAALARQRRAQCRTCLDWSERRQHLAGAAGAALFSRFLELGWARRTRNSRAVIFSALGHLELRRKFQIAIA